ncbi:MAG: hypothetical protein AAGC74_09195 [Verrucomicrobiota bacterium]
MSNPDTTQPSENEDLLLENDAVWDLLDQAPPPDAGPMFSRNLMREIRLAEPEPRSLLGFLSWPRAAFAAAFALLGIAFLLNLSDPVADNNAGFATNTDPAPTSEPDALSNYLQEELLLAAADDPGLLSDEDLVALLF